MIRRAGFTDLPQLLLLALEAHKRSRYSDVELDMESAERLARQLMMMSPEKPEVGGHVCFVSDEDGKLTGFLAGSIQQFYGCLDIAIAQDFLFFVLPEAAAAVAQRLLDAFEAWAFGLPGRVVVRFVVNDAIVNPDRTGVWMARRGYQHIGYAFEKEKVR